MRQSTNDLLNLTTRKFRDAKIDNASQEARMLLSFVLRKTPQWLMCHADEIVDDDTVAKVEEYITRRLNGEPLAYIFGKWEFCGLELIVNKNTLIPRVETEILVNIAEKLIGHRTNLTIYDVGCGSGAISVAIGYHNRNNKIIGFDISPSALKVARKNIIKFNLVKTIRLRKYNLLDKAKRPADIIIANLPYVPSNDCRKLADPKIALDGGRDGLDLITKLFKQIHERELVKPHGAILLEIGFDQAEKVCALSKKLFNKPKITIYKDLANFDRVVQINLP